MPIFAWPLFGVHSNGMEQSPLARAQGPIFGRRPFREGIRGTFFRYRTTYYCRSTQVPIFELPLFEVPPNGMEQGPLRRALKRVEKLVFFLRHPLL